MGAELSDSECRTLFDVFDGNLDGKVDAGEFAHVLHTARSGAAMAELQLRTLKRMSLGFDAPRVRALQGASAHAQARALGLRHDGEGRTDPNPNPKPIPKPNPNPKPNPSPDPNPNPNPNPNRNPSPNSNQVRVRR